MPELTREHDQSAPREGDRVLDLFGRSALPADLSRSDRVKLVAEAADALLRGELPSAAARMFVGGALSAWLRDGGRVGSLERDFLRVTQGERSRLTPQRLLARCARTTTSDIDASTMQSDQTCTEPDDET